MKTRGQLPQVMALLLLCRTARPMKTRGQRLQALPRLLCAPSVGPP